ncbi:tyrosine-type recombinase/integrase [Citrobacter sp. NCU1]|uniref:tyrosine-type recombinase/integrase n=1 Tax=Citrobacter sp. NCU1 TaxID=2026683 RepID=UPI001390B29F|nr:site-specific integrase [Citrobacter sp. NCU1]
MIRARGASWQVDVVVDGKRIRRSVSSYADAHDMHLRLGSSKVAPEIARESDQRKPQRRPTGCPPVPVDTPSMEDMLELTWFRDWSHQKDGEGSKRRATAVLEDMGWLKWNPAEITKKRLLYLRDFYQRKGNCNGTINRKLNSVTKLLSTAFDEELIHHKPHVRLLPERNTRERVITTLEEEALLYWLHELHYGGAWYLARFLIDTGCRVGEAVSLRPHNVSHKLKTVSFENTKNGTSRCVPLTDRALDSVLKWGSKINVRLFEYNFYRARDHAGIGKDVVPHTLRHTCLTRLAQSGISMAIIQAWAGHKSIRTTNRYLHLNVSNLDTARNALNNFTDTEE